MLYLPLQWFVIGRRDWWYTVNDKLSPWIFTFTTAHCPTSKFIKDKDIHSGSTTKMVWYTLGINVRSQNENLFWLEQPCTLEIDMKVLNRETLFIHLVCFWHPISEKQNQNHGHGLLVPSVLQNIVSDLMFRTGSDIISMITRIYHRSIGGDYWPLAVTSALAHNINQLDGFSKRSLSSLLENKTKIMGLSTLRVDRKCRITMFGANRSIGDLSCMSRMHTTYGLAYASHIHRLWPLCPHVCKPLEYALLITALNATRGLVLHYTRC